MPDPKVEDVFKLSGVPTFTFVKPLEYEKLYVALRTPGRGVVIEGPSGIGKTTTVSRVLSELGTQGSTLTLSARKPDDAEFVKALPTLKSSGTVQIDDFHRLDESTQRQIADYLKTLADEERTDTKLILIGINKTGDTLVQFAADLNTRIDTIRFEKNPEDRVLELVQKGEQALNVKISAGRDIAKSANGSFLVAQMLSFETCLAEGVKEAVAETKTLSSSIEATTAQVMETLSRRFMSLAIRFASGTKLRREGRAPYLHMLKWLAESNEWSILLDHEIANHPDQKASVGQVVEKGYLAYLLKNAPELAAVLHYVPATRILTVEDPQFIFFLRNLSWTKFAERVGYLNIHFDSEYDFALSFAGPDRPFAKRLFELLAEEEMSVFFDENEQHRILGEEC